MIHSLLVRPTRPHPVRARPLLALLRSSAARPLRFAGTGVTAGGCQLILLTLLISHGWNAIVANAAAFLLAAQLNFALSLAFTWRDRAGSLSPLRCWLLFHGSIALMALVNMLVFALARSLVPPLAASAAGIAAGALGNYLVGDRLVFRRPPASAATNTERRYAA